MIRKHILVLLVAFFCFGVIAHKALEKTRLSGIEDLVLQNPAYMVAEYNRICFPVYDDLAEGSWDHMYDHPPFHYIFTGVYIKILGLRSGVIIYHLSLVMLLFITVLFCRESHLFKLCFILGIAGFILYHIRKTGFAFQFRPEMGVTLWWLSGIIWLKNAIDQGWKLWQFLLGTMLFTIGCLTHYFAMPAFPGIIVIWMYGWLASGSKAARRSVMFSVAAGCSMLLLYFVVFVLPVYDLIYHLTFGMQKTWIADHAIYSLFDKLRHYNEVHDLAYPLGIFSALGLLLFSSTRLIGIMAMPMVFGLVFYLNIKKPYYIVPETALFALMICAFTCWALKKIVDHNWKKIEVPSVGQTLMFILLSLSWLLIACSGSSKFTWADKARKAAQEIVGQKATVSGSHPLWYVSGAYVWKNGDNRLLNLSAMTKNEIFAGVDFIGIHTLPKEISTQLHAAGRYFQGQMELSGIVTGDITYIIYGKKKADKHTVLAFHVTEDSVSKFVIDDNGLYAAGALAVYGSAEKTSLPFLEHQHTVLASLNTESLSPNYITFFITPLDSLNLLERVGLETSSDNRIEVFQKFRVSKYTYTSDHFMTMPPTFNAVVTFERF